MTLVYQNGFARPPDVPAFVAQPIVYASGADPTIIGDGVGTRGSPMPVLSAQLTDIPSTATGWLVAGDLPSSIPPGTEPKFRFHLNVSHLLPDDPIRNYGQPGTSHLHQFFGNTTTNAFSTYASLRNRANENAAASRAASTGAGGPYNGTGYWIPAMLDTGTGKVVEPGMFFGYYTNESVATALLTQRLPRGLRYVFGFPMDDPTGSVEAAELAAANALPGNSGRYSSTGHGFRGWTLLSPDTETIIQTTGGQNSSPCLKNVNGSDPWGGAAYAGCWFKATLFAPSGYDGTNLWSPGGYKHLRQPWNDSHTGQNVHPQGWYHLPTFQIFPFYQATSSTSHLTWRLSSDDHIASVLGTAVANGTTLHGDWLGAWDDLPFGADTGWQIQCTAAKNGATPHECGSGCFDAAGTRLLGSIGGDNAPDGSRVPQVNFFETRALRTIPASFSGPATLRARAA